MIVGAYDEGFAKRSGLGFVAAGAASAKGEELGLGLALAMLLYSGHCYCYNVSALSQSQTAESHLLMPIRVEEQMASLVEIFRLEVVVLNSAYTFVEQCLYLQAHSTQFEALQKGHLDGPFDERHGNTREEAMEWVFTNLRYFSWSHAAYVLAQANALYKSLRYLID